MVLVTGGLGFIGSHVCRELVAQDERVVVFDNFSQGNFEFLKKVRMPDICDKVEFVSGDITDFAFVFETLKEHGIEKIIHTAAITFIPTAIKKPSLTFNVNTVGSFNLLEASRILDLDRFVYISTASTYGDFQYSPADEKHPLNPKDIYGATKVAADRLACSYFHTYGLSASIVRTSAVYGPGDLERRAAKAFIENALQGIPMKLEGGGLQMRDFSYVKDVASGMVLALNSSKSAGEAFNVTGGSEYSVKNLAETIHKYIPGSKIEVTDARKVDAKRGMLDISKAMRVLGYKPKYSFDAGIREYVRWMADVYAPLFGLKVKNPPVFD